MKHRDGILDLVRGGSAMLVMLGHLRALVLVDFQGLVATGPLTKAFYLATGLGHQAVMVFFVLSGYFVGGSVLGGLISGSFTWKAYALARLARLWMVLIPALFLTLGLDSLGAYFCPSAYAGNFHEHFMSGPTTNEPAAWGALAFLGNLAFLQTIVSPVYGSNGPLWSLANEFWYYVLFPLLAVGVAGFVHHPREQTTAPAVGTNRHIRYSGFGSVLMIGCAVALAFWLPWPLVSAGLIWLLGVFVWWATRSSRATKLCRNWIWRSVFGLAFLGTLVASKTNHILGSDLAVGISFALWVPSLLGAWSKNGWWSRLSTGLSEISYTLYVVHFPILFCAAAVLLNGRQFGFDAHGLSWFAALAALAVCSSGGLWFLFERNTGRVRKILEKRFGRTHHC